MNTEKANAVPLGLILEKLGLQPVKAKPHSAFYLSPLRSEKTPSLHVHPKKNVWYDHGIGKGGTTIDLVCAYLESQRQASTVSDALRWIENMAGLAPAIKPIALQALTYTEPVLSIKSLKPITHPALKRYLDARGVATAVAMTHMTEAHVQNSESGKTFFAIGFKNEEEGYELRNPFFKGVAGPKAISFVRGKRVKPAGIHLFEGFMDYASALTHKAIDGFDDDAIVLNSLALLSYATPYIKGYGYRHLYSWMDNDAAGEKAVHSLASFCATEPGLCHHPQNELYAPHVDVNAWHARHSQPGLR